MNNLMQVFGLNQSGQGFYMLGKNCVEAFGMTRACFIGILADIDSYSKSQGNERFFATLDTLMQKTRLSDKTIKKLMRELKDYKILDEGIKGEGDDNKKYYIFDYEMLGKIIAERVGNSTPKVEGKNTLNIKGNSTPKVEGKNTPQIITNNIKTNSIITNSAERILPKKEVKKSKIDLAKDFFLENSHKITNNHFDLDLWIKWIAYKIKKTRKFGSESFEFQFKKLLECESRAREAIEYSIGQGYQGLFLPNGNAKPQKYQYDPRKGNTGQSDFSDNPDDYINENMAGVKKVGDGIFEADLWKLTGRKQ